MTGYGEASSHEDGVHYFLDVRSLNNKYFKCVIRLPEDLQGLEAELESSLRRRLTRGAVTLMARCTDASASVTHTINAAALRRYLDQLREANLESDGVTIDGGALLSLPGVLQPPADEEERLHRARDAMLKLLNKACDQLEQMREREGEIVLRDLLDQRDVIITRLDSVSERAPQVVQEYEARLRSRINQLLEGSNLKVEPADLIREIAVYAERSDIAEELARLRGHMEQFAELIENKDRRPVGRTLDFLAQEMLREANTIASKSGDNAVARDIVEVKGAIDRIKEQVQNVE
ncbi:MAG: YicC family protein [Phycisphaerales bacterium]|nr:MAG: YicC family protein [Phycisphaerales bacterium]